MAALICLGLLVAAVGATWYGPLRNRPDLLVTVPGETICGTTVRVNNGVLTIKTAGGERDIKITDVVGLAAADAC
jgi:hypothetical protein